MTLEEAAAANTSLLSRKIARSPEGSIDVEPPSSMDDSSMIIIEIRIDVVEGPHTNIMIGVGRNPWLSQGDQSSR